jgi:UDP-N-acetylglucosamine 1-carboxyvinyltransferase
MTQGDITIIGGREDHLAIPLDKLVQAGAVVTTTQDGFRVRMDHRPRAIDIVTLPYPGFPTDLQPMAICMNSIAEGHSMVTENVFEGRFMFVNELKRLGANITVDGHHAAINGLPLLSGAPVVATDIRAGAGLVLAGLVSEGITVVEDGYHVDRGYTHFAENLRALGAEVSRIEN